MKGAIAKTEAETRDALLRRAALIALAGNLVLAILKITVGAASGSLAVLGDGIDSSTDVVIAIMTLAVGFYVSQPSDKEHPWGHGRAETLATIVLAFVVFFAGTRLFESAIERLRSGEAMEIPSTVTLVVTGISIAGKISLALGQFRLAKLTGSSMLKANARNMANDVVISASVFVGLAVTILFKLAFLDSVIALLVGLWVMKAGIGIFREQNLELMDGNADDELYRTLFAAVKSVDGAANPHRARIRRIATAWDIDLDIEVDACLTVREAHAIAARVEEAVREQIPFVYDIMVHVEPAGSGEHNEQYGLSAKDVR